MEGVTLARRGKFGTRLLRPPVEHSRQVVEEPRYGEELPSFSADEEGRSERKLMGK